VIHVQLPTLAERAGDIPLLVNAFLEKFCTRIASAPKRFSQEAMKCLVRYSWPGNVRELENVVERAVALAGGREVLEPDDLPDEVLSADAATLRAVGSLGEGATLDDMLEGFETRLVLQALEASRWVKSRAASKLGIKRTTLVEKMKRLGIALRHEA
jgi:DNA-binding NtrC family response regulator